MDILVLYKSYRIRERRTMLDHLYSFERYADGCRFVYLDVGKIFAIPRCIAEYPFDAVIFHYLFLGYRIDRPEFVRLYERIRNTLTHLHGVKILMPQDDYLGTDILWQIIRDCGVKRVYTCSSSQDYRTIYPPEKVAEGDLFRTVLPGYVDETLQKKIDGKEKQKSARTYDIGYRALQSSYVFGKHGHLKSEVAQAFLLACENHPEIRADIRMVGDGYKNALTGDSWLRYLLDCRATIGCLGGSSLLDIDGSLRSRTLAYVAQHPDASYEDVEAHCFPGMDGRIAEFTTGPRHFECAMTKTCQLLVEGDYQGIFAPGRDFIEIKRDFSNMDDVLRQVSDGETCERIAAQCYEDVVQSGRYTYRSFVLDVMEDIRRLMSADIVYTEKAKKRALRFAYMRAIAALVHTVNQCQNAVKNTAKACVARLTRGNSAQYEKIKAWYKHR